MTDTDVGGELLLERFHLWPKDEPAGVKDAREGSVQFAAYRGMCASEIGGRNHVGMSVLRGQLDHRPHAVAVAQERAGTRHNHVAFRNAFANLGV